ncbi:MAG: TetR family transcriptional regulator [Ilumatobacteraceae bacterium]
MSPSSRRTGRALRNDVRLRKSAARVIQKFGVDGVSMALIASDAGLTTGALYGRFEVVDDVLVDLWKNGAGGAIFALVEEMLPTSPDVDSEVGNRRNIDPLAECGLQILIASRRNLTIAEAIEADLKMWTEKWSLGSSSSPTQRMRSAVLLSTIFGRLASDCLVHGEDRYRSMYEQIHRATEIAESEEIVHESAGLEVIAVGGDPLSNDLINATMDVIAKSGVEQSTLSRISRRAGVTTGAIYSRYESKIELLIDAIEVLVATVARTSSKLVIIGAQNHDMSTSVARMFHTAVSPDRSPWNRFRLETYLAGLSNPAIRRCLRRIQATSDERYFSLLQPTKLFSDKQISEIALAGQIIPVGLSVLDIICSGHRDIDYLDVSRCLMRLLGAS